MIGAPMALPLLASVDDLEVRLGQPVDNTDQAEALLSYASALIRAHTGNDYVDADGALVVLPDGVSQVCVEMVFRAVTNPAGVTQDTTGPFSVSFGSDAAQRIYLSRSDKLILTGRRGLQTVSTTRGDIETRTVYVDTIPSGDPLPIFDDPAY